MTDYTKLYIDGAWVPSDGSETIDVINPSTEQVIAAVPAGTAADVDRAVAAARAAFETWGFTSKEERGKYLQAIAEGLAGAQRGDRARSSPTRWACRSCGPT